MRSLPLHSLILALAISFPGYGNAADKYGQEVSDELEAQVLGTRQFRLPYASTYKPTQAIQILEQVVEKKPDYFRAHFNLGLAHHENRDYVASVKSFDKAIELSKGLVKPDVSVLNTAGWVSLKNEDYGRAEKLLLEAYEKSTDAGSFTHTAIRNNLGELYFLTQKFAESKKMFTESMGIRESESAKYYLDVIARIESKVERLKK